MRIVTKEEAKVLDFNPRYGKYGLLDKERNSLFLTSDNPKSCTDALERMTPEHPRFKYMELVQAPED